MDGREYDRMFGGLVRAMFLFGLIAGVAVGVPVILLLGWLMRHLRLGWH